MRKEKQRPKSWKEESAPFPEDDWRRTFVGFNWCCQWISYELSRWAFLEVLEYLGKLTILISLILWIYPGFEQRRQAVESAKQAAADARKSRHYVAWQTINSAVGKPGNAGRVDALQDLNSDGVQLDGISLSGHAALAGPMDLTKASMTFADFSDGKYINVNFSLANLDFSTWSNAMCESCNFQGTSLWASKFSGSTFVWCDFGCPSNNITKGGALIQTQFQGNQTKFTICNFAGAALPMNIWTSAYFNTCNFAYADLSHILAQPDGSMFCCNLFGAKASLDFVKWAKTQLTAFTNIVSLPQWNYCVTNRGVVFQKGGDNFMNWASNQFIAVNGTNDSKMWLNWKKDNLDK
jgi:uncharacterized protein YjbI with pentapeptide repeats